MKPLLSALAVLEVVAFVLTLGSRERGIEEQPIQLQASSVAAAGEIISPR